MKYVRKGGPPHGYSGWCQRVRGTVNENYGCLQNPEKRSLLLALLREQGWLCAYTMRRIEESSSHIEHIKPESVCRSERIGLDLGYRNLLACFPLDGMGRKHRYGAQQKGNWWSNNGAEFVSPLHPNCEKRFCFNSEGQIQAIKDHVAAVTTIRVLGLDHPSLTEDRKKAIHEYVFGESGAEPLSSAAASRAIHTLVTRNSDGSFYEFCVAIRDALVDHIKGLRKLAKQRSFTRRR